MASLKSRDTVLSIRKIHIRPRGLVPSTLTSTGAESNLLSTSSCSPMSPKRIRVIDMKRSRRKRSWSTGELSDMSTVSSSHSPVHSVRPSARLERLLESVVEELWNRDGSVDPQFASHFDRARSTALWYACQYITAQPHAMLESEEVVIALAAVFITFKAVDYIPGAGRIKMHQLLDAYERASRFVFTY